MPNSNEFLESVEVTILFVHVLRGSVDETWYPNEIVLSHYTTQYELPKTSYRDTRGRLKARRSDTARARS